MAFNTYHVFCTFTCSVFVIEYKFWIFMIFKKKSVSMCILNSLA